MLKCHPSCNESAIESIFSWGGLLLSGTDYVSWETPVRCRGYLERVMRENRASGENHGIGVGLGKGEAPKIRRET